MTHPGTPTGAPSSVFVRKRLHARLLLLLGGLLCAALYGSCARASMCAFLFPRFAVFYDHLYHNDQLRHVIQRLITIRKRNGIHCRSEVGG